MTDKSLIRILGLVIVVMIFVLRVSDDREKEFAKYKPYGCFQCGKLLPWENAANTIYCKVVNGNALHFCGKRCMFTYDDEVKNGRQKDS